MAYQTIDYPRSVGETPSDKQVVLSVRDLAVSFRTEEGYVHAVRNVSFDLYKEETLCIVGESGSGKSVTNKTIMGILPNSAHIDSGSVIYEGEDLTKVSEDEFHRIRGNKIGMIFQDPLSSLNPIMKIGKQITEEMIINGNHLKNYYDSIINEEFIAYKNQVRLRQINRDEARHQIKKLKDLNRKLKKDGDIHGIEENLAKIAQIKAERDANDVELLAKLRELKLALDEKKKEARGLVNKRRQEIFARHKEGLSEILHKNCSLKEKWAYFISEHRRYVSETRVTRKEAKARALKVMAEVGIPNPEARFDQYPFEFSGGMRQRIVIAIALTAEPDVLICDEPTTALDVTIQAQILELINRLKASHHMSVIFITHDLGVVANMADRVAVMYAGKIVEYGTAEDVFYHPAHPYTWALLSSIPDVDSKEKLEAIPGTPPNMLFPPVGDAFADRSRYAMAVDYKAEPPMFQLSETHYAATWLLDERAPKAEMPRIVSTRIKNSLKKAKGGK